MPEERAADLSGVEMLLTGDGTMHLRGRAVQPDVVLTELRNGMGDPFAVMAVPVPDADVCVAPQVEVVCRNVECQYYNQKRQVAMMCLGDGVYSLGVIYCACGTYSQARKC